MNYEAIVVIVERGKANDVVKKVTEAGARGATIIYGRGAGGQVLSFFRSLQVEASKEILFIIADENNVQRLLEVAAEAAHVKEQGKGIAFTVPIRNLIGIRPPHDDGKQNA